MIDYKATFTNTDGVNFPNTKAVNVTTPGAGDGTEFIAAMVNDSWGWHQALVYYSGQTPDTVTEAPGTSQMVEACRRSFGAPGEVVGWHGQTDPALTPFFLRLLLLEGQGVLRTDYPLLDAAVYCGDPNNGTWEAYYHADDAAGTSRNTAGVYLILADARGLALRGHDPTAIYDPQGSIRNFPDTQTHSVISHYHEVTTITSGQFATVGAIPSATGPREIVEPEPSLGSNSYRADTMALGGPHNPDETRMSNFQVKWCVRY